MSPIEAAEALAALSPQTEARLAAWRDEGWDGGEAPYTAFRAIGAAIASKRTPVSAPDLTALFAFVERLLAQGSGDVPNLVATCMLEELRDAARGSGFDFATVDPYLGPEARRYLVAWDRFNNTRTPGLTGAA